VVSILFGVDSLAAFEAGVEVEVEVTVGEADVEDEEVQPARAAAVSAAPYRRARRRVGCIRSGSARKRIMAVAETVAEPLTLWEES
jgi:hypothetical protein